MPRFLVITRNDNINCLGGAGGTWGKLCDLFPLSSFTPAFRRFVGRLKKAKRFKKPAPDAQPNEKKRAWAGMTTPMAFDLTTTQHADERPSSYFPAASNRAMSLAK
jgi:hypothetical protein